MGLGVGLKSSSSAEDVVMRNLIVVAVSVVLLASTSMPAGALPHVDYVRSEIPSRYSGDVEKFCLRGYARHNWMPVLPRQGVWTIINPYKPVNFQYIPSFMQRCMSGGSISSNVPG